VGEGRPRDHRWIKREGELSRFKTSGAIADHKGIIPGEQRRSSPLRFLPFRPQARLGGRRRSRDVSSSSGRIQSRSGEGSGERKDWGVGKGAALVTAVLLKERWTRGTRGPGVRHGGKAGEMQGKKGNYMEVGIIYSTVARHRWREVLSE